ncbi:MAG: gamma carbonic anhydrase family protein [Proteobacteria bacterium]|nr:gamma carbonic anhydrase family protein [Pseudomonadota bacterium]MBI3497365.1 gamma carbonic anhydrase family protein [Pseudomonadota bacterium]
MSGLILPFMGISPRIAADAYIAETAAVIGDVEVGSEASLWFGVVARGDYAKIRIGARTNVQDGTIIHIDRAPIDTVIGADILIGHAAVIHACTLEDRCFVGMKACVMDGAVVETGAMVAAGALVTPGKHVRKGELWAGNPAKLLRPLRADESEKLTEAAAHYVEFARQFRKEQEARLRAQAAQ